MIDDLRLTIENISHLAIVNLKSSIDKGGVMELKVKDFESALKSLEDIVAQLEAGDLTLDRALELFEEGIKVSRFCSSKLEEAERKVEVLIKTASGDMKETPFSEDAEANEP
jgi:exodeoxyribonuclease VII small subunit